MFILINYSILLINNILFVISKIYFGAAIISKEYENCKSLVSLCIDMLLQCRLVPMLWSKKNLRGAQRFLNMKSWVPGTYSKSNI